MEKIILGLLMLRSMTIYEMKTTIHSKMNSMCSDSAGSLHTVIKILMKKEYIQCVEDGRKKIYFITAAGREAFTQWVATPMNRDKAKNIEASKIFFMGMVSQEQVQPLVENYIESLQQEFNMMSMIYSSCIEQQKKILEQSKDTILQDKLNNEGIMSNLSGRSLDETILDIYTYQMEILQYAIGSLQFEINWFNAFLKRKQERDSKGD